MGKVRRTPISEKEKQRLIDKSNENFMKKKTPKPGYKKNPWWFEKHLERRGLT